MGNNSSRSGRDSEIEGILLFLFFVEILCQAEALLLTTSPDEPQMVSGKRAIITRKDRNE
jgi:hypothetical protein